MIRSQAALAVRRAIAFMKHPGFGKRMAWSFAWFAVFSVGPWANAQFAGMPQPKHYPWSDTSLSPDARADLVIKELTLDEKIQLLHGLGWQMLFAPPDSGPATRAVSVLGFIPGVPRLGIPDLQMTDSVE